MMHNVLGLQNPYTGQSLIGFLQVFVQRLGAYISGSISFSDIAPDELQVVVLMGIAISGAMTGTFLVLRRMTMLANSLSHTILLGIVLAFLFTQNALSGTGKEEAHSMNIYAMLGAALAVGMATTFLTEFLSRTVRLQEDASTGIVFTSLFALGIIFVTLATRDAHIGTEAVMGNIDALHLDDFGLVLIILAINLVLIALFFKEFQITTFDPGLSKALGISPAFFNYLLMVQTACTAIGGFRAVGVLMVLAFVTGPSLIARLWCHGLRKLLITSALVGCLASLLGVGLSRHVLSNYDVALSTGGVVVCVIMAMYILSIIWKFSRRTALN